MTQTRHELKVILFTDIVGYTAMMGMDEKVALSVLSKNKEIHKKWLSQFNGKWLKEMGDGILASFESIVDAVYCAGAILSESKNVEELDLRIGIHLGDVVIDGNEIYGDGINIASRIQGIAEKNQITISEIVHSNIKNKEGIQSSFLGEKILKNVPDPVAAYSVEFDSDISFVDLVTKEQMKSKNFIKWVVAIVIVAATFFVINHFYKDVTEQTNLTEASLIKSIAVLPFDNLTGDSTQNHLIAMMQDNLITTLSQIKSVDVISRTSTLSYKVGGDKTVQKIARELNVDAIIESSVISSSDSIRINVQLIQAFPVEKHLWAKIFDRPFDNILFLFDDVAEAVSNEVHRALQEKNTTLSSVPREINTEAYKAYMNGQFLAINMPTAESLEKALEYYHRSIEIDSTFAPAYAGISWVWISLRQMGAASGSEAVPKIYSNNSKALELNPNFPDAQYHKAVISFQNEWDWEKSEKAFLRALELNPNHAMAHAHFSHLLMYQQRFEEAIHHVEMAMKLDPLSPHVLGLCAIVYWHNRDFDKALEITNTNPFIFGKPLIEESIAYLKGDLQASIKMLEQMYGRDSIMFKTVMNEYKENGYQASMKQLAQSLDGGNYPVAAVGIAIIYNRAGMIDDAIRVLEEGYKNHDPNMPYAFIPVELENLENNPRYIALAAKMNLPR